MQSNHFFAWVMQYGLDVVVHIVPSLFDQYQWYTTRNDVIVVLILEIPYQVHSRIYWKYRFHQGVNQFQIFILWVADYQMQSLWSLMNRPLMDRPGHGRIWTPSHDDSRQVDEGGRWTRWTVRLMDGFERKTMIISAEDFCQKCTAGGMEELRPWRPGSNIVQKSSYKIE